MAIEFQSRLSPLKAPVDWPNQPLAARARGLTRRFGERTVIDSLDLDLHAGEFVALLGASGCGKSTLLRVLAGLDNDMAGEVLVTPQRRVAFQAPRLMPWKRVAENVGLGYRGKDAGERVARALSEVGLSHRAAAWPRELSGGEAQRASLARALVSDPELMLLDEPFGALDALTRSKAQALVGQLWAKHGYSVLLVTHDVEEAVLLADRVVLMRNGRIAEEVVIDLPRPRDAADRSFIALRRTILSLIEGSVRRA